MECCSQMRRSRMTHSFFFKACFRRNGALCRRPLLFEQTASIQNLGRNRGGRFRQLRLLGSFFPYRAEVARGPVLINRLQVPPRSEEHTSELQSQSNLVCRLLLEKKKNLLADFRHAIALASASRALFHLLIGRQETDPGPMPGAVRATAHHIENRACLPVRITVLR